MIREKDVITIKIPYPNSSSDLAVYPHMYICNSVNDKQYKYIKCQTAKPAMLFNKKLAHFIYEEPNIARNPFKRLTAIDCGKLFITNNVEYGDNLKTTNRSNISDDLFNDINQKLAMTKYDEIEIDENILKKLNNKIY
ncbi:UNVERIFIED_CONTAM: hypothetical protein O8I53_10150 [Campylobacter lari]